MEVRTDLKLFESYLVPVLEIAYGVAWYLTTNDVQAEILMQKAVLKAYAAFPDHALLSDFKIRFLTILCAQFLSEARAQGRSLDLARWEAEADCLLATTALLSARQGIGAEDKTTLRDRAGRQEIVTVFARMPDEYRILCALYFLGEWSYQDIADIAGCSRDVARNRLHRGRKWLHRLLQSPVQEPESYPPCSAQPYSAASAPRMAALAPSL